jgi:L-ascorbate metabolism protein UlaG (beta-lactamase superfamily)
MIITHFGKQHFKIQQGDTTLAFNPVSKDSKFSSQRYGADIVFITTNTQDYNGAEMCEHSSKTPFVINGPGEYEVSDIFIKSFGSFTEMNIGKEKIKLQNTSYILSVDGIKICFLGCLHEELSPENRGLIDEVDILFIPVSSDENILNAYDANKLATKLEPKLIIPMDYDEASLKMFLKESGNEKVEKIEKLTIKKKDIEGKQGEVVIFNF